MKMVFTALICCNVVCLRKAAELRSFLRVFLSHLSHLFIYKDNVGFMVNGLILI